MPFCCASRRPLLLLHLHGHVRQGAEAAQQRLIIAAGSGNIENLFRLIAASSAQSGRSRKSGHGWFRPFVEVDYQDVAVPANHIQVRRGLHRELQLLCFAKPVTALEGPSCLHRYADDG